MGVGTGKKNQRTPLLIFPGHTFQFMARTQLPQRRNEHTLIGSVPDDKMRDKTRFQGKPPKFQRSDIRPRQTPAERVCSAVIHHSPKRRHNRRAPPQRNRMAGFARSGACGGRPAPGDMAKSHNKKARKALPLWTPPFGKISVSTVWSLFWQRTGEAYLPGKIPSVGLSGD